jgi:hypothetical protein
MAQYLGVAHLGAEIHKIQPHDFSEKEWVGSFRCGKLKIPMPKLGSHTPGKSLPQEASEDELRLVAVAGFVAEACWDGETYDDLCDDWDYDPDIMSPTDWRMAGCAPGEPSPQLREAAEEAFRLLNREEGNLWNDLVREAHYLIERYR